MTEPYNETVRNLFSDLRHGGDLQSGGGRSLLATAGRKALGAQIVLAAGLSGDELREMKFRAYGCPHLVAACEYICRKFSGKSIALLADYSRQDLMETLAVPVEKSGRILLLEDAIGSILAQAAQN